MVTFLSLRIVRSSVPLHYVSPRALKSKQDPNKTSNHYQKNPNEFIKHRFQMDAAKEDTASRSIHYCFLKPITPTGIPNLAWI